MIDSYFVSYFSNQSSDYFTDNKSYKFNIFLPHETFFPRELSEKKLIVGLKSLSFQFVNNVDNPKIIGLKSSLIDQSNKSDDQIFFMTQVNPRKTVQYFSVSHPLYFTTNRRSLASPSFEFTSYNPDSGKFKSLPPNILREDITIHVQVEIKAIDSSMNLQHFNVLVSSDDKESEKMFPSNKPYDFTIVKRLEFPENEKWVMGLKSIIIPSLIQNAELPDFGIRYKLEMIPKDKEKHLPYVETYSGDLPKKHFESANDFFVSLSKLLKKISLIGNGFIIKNNKLKINNPLYLVYKASLLKRPPPPPRALTPTPPLLPSPSPDPVIEEFLDDSRENLVQTDKSVEEDIHFHIGLPVEDDAEMNTFLEDNEEVMEDNLVEDDVKEDNALKELRELINEMEEDKNFLKRARQEDGDGNEVEMEDNVVEENEVEMKDDEEEMYMEEDKRNLKRGRQEEEDENENTKVQKITTDDVDGHPNATGTKPKERGNATGIKPKERKRKKKNKNEESDNENKIRKEKRKKNKEERRKRKKEKKVIKKEEEEEEEEEEVEEEEEEQEEQEQEEQEEQEQEEQEDFQPPFTSTPIASPKNSKEEEDIHLHIPLPIEDDTIVEEDIHLYIPLPNEEEDITVEEEEQIQEVSSVKKDSNEPHSIIESAQDYTISRKILLDDIQYNSEYFPRDLFLIEENIANSLNRQDRSDLEVELAQTKATHTFNLYFELSRMLAKMFGIADENRIIKLTDADLWKNYNNTFCESTQETNLNFAIPQTILVTCDLVEESLVGNQKIPLLKHIFLGDKVFMRDRQYQFEFNIDQWHEVKMKNSSRFNLSVKDLLGNQLSLQESQRNLSTIVELIFKRVNHDYHY